MADRIYGQNDYDPAKAYPDLPERERLAAVIFDASIISAHRDWPRWPDATPEQRETALACADAAARLIRASEDSHG